MNMSGYIAGVVGVSALLSSLIAVVIYVITMRDDINALIAEARVQRGIVKSEILTQLQNCRTYQVELESELRACP